MITRPTDLAAATLLAALALFSSTAKASGRNACPKTSRTNICAALMQVSKPHHRIPSISNRNTVDAARALQLFRVNELQIDDIEPSAEELDTRSPDDASKVAARIEGFERHFPERSSGSVRIWGITVSGQQKVLDLLNLIAANLATNNAANPHKRFENAAKNARTPIAWLLMNSMVTTEFIACGLHKYLFYNTCLTLMMLSAPAMSYLVYDNLKNGHGPLMRREHKRMASDPGFLPEMLSMVQDTQPLTPGQWHYAARNDRMPRWFLDLFMAASSHNLQELEAADGSSKLTKVDALLHHDALARQMFKRQIKKHGDDIKRYELINVLSDILFRVDEDGVPRLTLALRFMDKKPQYGRRKKAAEEEREESLDGALEEGLVLAPARPSQR